MSENKIKKLENKLNLKDKVGNIQYCYSQQIQLKKQTNNTLLCLSVFSDFHNLSCFFNR